MKVPACRRRNRNEFGNAFTDRKAFPSMEVPGLVWAWDYISAGRLSRHITAALVWKAHLIRVRPSGLPCRCFHPYRAPEKETLFRRCHPCGGHSLEAITLA